MLSLLKDVLLYIYYMSKYLETLAKSIEDLYMYMSVLKAIFIFAIKIHTYIHMYVEIICKILAPSREKRPEAGSPLGTALSVHKHDRGV